MKPKFPLLSLIYLSLLACHAVAQSPAEPVRMNPNGIGIDGYSPVSYFTAGVPERGDPEYSSQHDGVTYLFTSEDQVDLFELNPTRYLPAHGGWCTLMMGGSGRRTPGHPESWVIVDDRLMLFWSGDTDETKGMGLANWHSKNKGKIKKERKYIARADKQWASFVSGERDAKIFLYKRSDAESVSEAQRGAAKEAYIDE